MTNSKNFPKVVKDKIANATKMLENKDKGSVMKISFQVNGIEIFDFEKDMPVPRKQQKLSDIPKK